VSDPGQAPAGSGPPKGQPERLGKYEIVERLGQGGMGTVYKARDTIMGRWVAVKLLAPFLAEADCLLIDGTFWTEDELVRLGISAKRARDMGHLPQSGPGGMIDVLKPLKAGRKILIHINNTNPILDEDSAERRALDAAAIEVAYDGMEIEL